MNTSGDGGVVGSSIIADPTFRARLAGQLGVDSLLIRSVQQIFGGASKQMWSFDAVPDADPGRAIPLVIRIDTESSLLADNRQAEIAAHGYVGDKGLLPVPTVILASGEGEAGPAYFVMSRLPGSASARDLMLPEYQDQRAEIVSAILGLGGRLAAHPLDVGLLGPHVRVPPSTPARAELDKWSAQISGTGISRAVTDFTLTFLCEHEPPAPDRLALVHGDFRVGNVLFTQVGPTGVLDWELVHLGDPLEDLAWALAPSWRPQGAAHLIGGALTENQAIAAWEASAGAPVDRRALSWWRLLCHVKANAIWMSGVSQFASGASNDLVFGMFGWKNVAREELWMLDLIKGVDW